MSSEKIFSIHEAIPRIMKELGAIEKNKSTTGNGPTWKYRGIDDFLNALNPLLSKYGCFIVPEMLNRTNFERVSKSGGLNFHSLITYKFTVFASDGTSVSGSTDGEAMDTSDKASGKAISYALKTFLVSTFCVPTQDTQDTDYETHHEAMDTTVEKKKSNSEYQQKHVPQDEPITDRQVDLLREAREAAKLSVDDIKKIMLENFKTNDYRVLKSWEMKLLISMVNKKAVSKTKQT